MVCIYGGISTALFFVHLLQEVRSVVREGRCGVRELSMYSYASVPVSLVSVVASARCAAWLCGRGKSRALRGSCPGSAGRVTVAAAAYRRHLCRIGAHTTPDFSTAHTTWMNSPRSHHTALGERPRAVDARPLAYTLSGSLSKVLRKATCTETREA